MQEIIDMHCHILPGLDDGAETMEETLETLRAAESQNVKAMIVTPHFYPEKYEPAPSQILGCLWRVRRECADQGIQVELYPGQECMYYSGLVEKLSSSQVLTLAGSVYVLVEFEPECSFRYLAGGLRELRQAGYIPILAHFERYACLFREGHLGELKEQGFLIQMNFDRLLEPDRLFRKNQWRRMVKEGMVDFLGSDCHGVHYRPLRIGENQNWLEQELEPELRRRILERNVKRIIK